jgi:hypothetical protein
VGNPRPGAAVGVLLEGMSWESQWLGNTNEAGEFAFSVFGGAKYVTARFVGYADARMFPRADRISSSKLVLNLRNASPIRGVVRNEADMPVIGADVYVGLPEREWVRGEDGRHVLVATAPRHCLTDADGGFEFPDAAESGDRELVVKAEGYGAARFSLGLDEPRPNIVTLRVEQFATGEVRDASGLPVSGALVRWGEPNSFAFGEASTDSHGRFRLGGWSDELELTLLVTRPGYLRWQGRISTRVEPRIVLVPIGR